MKKVFGYLIIYVILFGACSVQNVDAQSANDAQRIVGTWKPNGESLTFTFNANGTVTVTGFMGWDNVQNCNIFPGTENGNYFINNSKLLLRFGSSGTVSRIIDYYLSSDGRVLVFNFVYDNAEGLNRRGDFWFIKQ